MWEGIPLAAEITIQGTSNTIIQTTNIIIVVDINIPGIRTAIVIFFLVSGRETL